MVRRSRLVIVAVTAFLVCTGFGSGERLFAPSADLWERWQANDPQNGSVIDHQSWDRFLKKYVVAGKDGLNLVRYRAVTNMDRQQLDGYIASLTSLSIRKFGRREQLAYWINLYNALTVKVVLDQYPVKSIRDIDISPGFFADGPWGRKLVAVEGEKISLNDIEHRILRPIWRDNRIHYAVNCASIGCPNLRTSAYTGATVEAMLEEAAGGYINSPRGVSIEGGAVTVSKIYDWFIGDFGHDEKTVLAHIKKYAAPALRKQVSAIGKIEDVTYDWRLNEVAN
ncbi:MAG: DUF547 domain-containing protein [Rhodospirillaceae bacterium]|nr:DUF547 domain-containing protein [Rhodospirillaceae bacterium]